MQSKCSKILNTIFFLSLNSLESVAWSKGTCACKLLGKQAQEVGIQEGRKANSKMGYHCQLTRWVAQNLLENLMKCASELCVLHDNWGMHLSINSHFLLIKDVPHIILYFNSSHFQVLKAHVRGFPQVFYTTASEKTQGKKQKVYAKLLLDSFCAKQTDGSTDLVSDSIELAGNKQSWEDIRWAQKVCDN